MIIKDSPKLKEYMVSEEPDCPSESDPAEKYDVVTIENDYSQDQDKPSKFKIDKGKKRLVKKKTQSMSYDLQKSDSLIIATSPISLSPNKRKRVTIVSSQNILSLSKIDRSKPLVPSQPSLSSIENKYSFGNSSQNTVIKHFPVITEGNLFDHKVYFARYKLQPVKIENKLERKHEKEYNVSDKNRLKLSKSIDSLEDVFRSFESKRLDMIKKYQMQIKNDSSFQYLTKQGLNEKSPKFIDSTQVNSRHIRMRSEVQNSFSRAYY